MENAIQSAYFQSRNTHTNSLSLSLSKQNMKAENEYKKGLWTQEEDRILLEYIRVHGRGQWNRIHKVTGNYEWLVQHHVEALPIKLLNGRLILISKFFWEVGLKRCGKSCRLRWLNYLSPNVKHGEFTEEEENVIIRLHNLLGNRFCLYASSFYLHLLLLFQLWTWSLIYRSNITLLFPFASSNSFFPKIIFIFDRNK